MPRKALGLGGWEGEGGSPDQDLLVPTKGLAVQIIELEE